jgi:hypothetical protein
MPPQAAAHDGFETHAPSLHPLTERRALLLAQGAEPVIVFGSERSLSVADEVEAAHRGIVRRCADNGCHP